MSSADKLQKFSPLLTALSFVGFVVFGAISMPAAPEPSVSDEEPERFDPDRMLKVSRDVIDEMRATGKVLRYKYSGDQYLYTLGSFDEDPITTVKYEGKRRIRKPIVEEIPGDAT